MNFRLGKFNFKCDDVKDGVPVNPVLPRNFDDRDNEDRPGRHMAWWNVPFIRTQTDNDPEFVRLWKGTTCFEVRCLDGGAWDRSTWWGQFAMLAEAVKCAKAGPAWRKEVAE